MPKTRQPKRLLIAGNGLRTRVKPIATLMGLAMLLTLVFAFVSPTKSTALATDTINFQARLESSSGSIAPDGTYNIEFKLYNVSSGGSALWTEDWLVANSANASCQNNGQGVTVHNGYISVSLGCVNPFPSTINWNQQLWLGMNIGQTPGTSCTPFSSCSPDGEMTPRLQLTATPYAFSSGSVTSTPNASGYQSELSLVQPASGVSSNEVFSIDDQGTGGSYTVCIQGASTANGGCAPSTGGTGYIQNQNASAQTSSNFWISGTGQAATLQGNTSVLTPDLDSISGALSIGASTATSVGIGNATTTTAISLTTTTAGTINIGTTGSTANTTTVNIATSTGAAQTINIGSTNTSGSVNLTSGTDSLSVSAPTGNITLSTNSASSGVGIDSLTNSSTAFEVQNASGVAILSTDTTANEVNIKGDLNLSQVANPSTAPTLNSYVASGSLTGNYWYVVNYVTVNGDTGYSSVSAEMTPSAQKVKLNIPTSTSGLVTARKIYRGTTSTGPFDLVGTVSNNTATTFTDNNTSPGAAAQITNQTAEIYVNNDSFLIADSVSGNTVVGLGSDQFDSSGISNSALGIYSLYDNSSGSYDTALGSGGLYNNTVGSNNTAVGQDALFNNTTGSDNTAIGYNAGMQDSGNEFSTLATIQNATAIGAYAQVQESNAIVLGSVDTPTLVGIGTTEPTNTLSVSPVDLDSTTITASQSSGSGTITASSSIFSASNVGETLIWADGTSETITGYTSGTVVTGSSTTENETSQYFRTQHPGLQVTNAGNTYIQSTSTTAFQVQNTAGTDLVQVDTSGNNLYLGDNSAGTGTSSTTVNIGAVGTESYTSSINIGTASGAAQTVSIGSNDSTSSLTLQGGSNGVAISTGTSTGNISLTTNNSSSTIVAESSTNSATAFQIQNSSGSSGVLLNADTSNMRIDIGTSGTPTGQLYVSGSLPSSASASIYSSDTQGFTVQGNYAYLTTGSSPAFVVVNISNQLYSSGLAITGSYSPAGGDQYNAVAVSGSYAYVSVMNSSGYGVGFQVLNIANPSAPTAASSIIALAANDPIDSIVVSGKYLYLLDSSTSGGSSVVYVYDISNPNNPTPLSSIVLANDDSQYLQMDSMAIANNYLFVTSAVANEVEAVNISSPAQPGTPVVTSLPTNSYPTALAVSGDLLYVTDTYSSGATAYLQIFNISNPASALTQVTSSSTVAPIGAAGNCPYANSDDVRVQGNYAYVAECSSNEINVMNVANPVTPQSVGTISTGASSTPILLYVQGMYADVLISSTLAIFNIGGEYAQQLQTGGLETGTLEVDANSNVGGDLSVQGGITVGTNAEVNGNVGVAGGSSIQGSTILSGGYDEFAVPAAPSVTFSGTTGTSATWSYEIVAVNAYGGDSSASTAGSITSSDNATLSGSSYNVISWSAVSGAGSYLIYRTAVGTSPTTTGLIGSTSGTTFNDTGLPGDDSSPPIVNTSGQLTALGSVLFQTPTDTTTAFQVQNASGYAVVTGDTTNGQLILGQSMALSGELAFANSSNAHIISLLSGTPTSSYSLTLPAAPPSATGQCLGDPSSTSQLAFTSCGAGSHNKQITLTPEYAGAVLTNCTFAGGGACSGSDSNIGTMTSGFDSSTSDGGPGLMSYYDWTSSQTSAQTYDVLVRIPVPSDWSSWAGTNLNIYYYDDNNSNTALSAQVIGYNGSSQTYDVGSSGSMSSVSLGTASQWNNVSYSLTNSDYAANGYVTIRLRMSADNNSNMRLGDVILDYNSAY